MTLKRNELLAKFEKEAISTKVQANNNVDRKVLDKLYARIIHLFEEKRPYLQAGFTLAQLSSMLDSNITYVSKAIQINNNEMNFPMFINSYRIRYCKEFMNKNRNRFTMEYVYESAGFANQSTFNKVFRLVEGITPTEYIQSLKAKDQTTKEESQNS
jgi:YesN/AraC family two-component response regulator